MSMARRTISSMLTGLENPLKSFTSGPLLTRVGLAGAGVAGLDFATGSIISPIAGAVHEFMTGKKQREARERLMLEHMLAKQVQAERAQSMQREQFIQMNARQVATYAPDIAQRVLAGRKLTQGGVAIGGRPRTDLLTELASYMSDGSLQ